MVGRSKKMDHYQHFGIASYMYAFYAARAEDQNIREDMEQYLRYLPVEKVYVENHRGLTDVPVKRLREIKAILEEYNVKVSGGITSRELINLVRFILKNLPVRDMDIVEVAPPLDVNDITSWAAMRIIEEVFSYADQNL